MITPRFFGTDGIRGKYGSKSMNENLAFSLGQAVGEYIVKKDSNEGTIIFGRDPRPSGMKIQNACANGLRSFGLRVLDAGILSTPALAFSVKEFMASMGIMITASHNPYEDNGIKLLSSTGSKLPLQVEHEIDSLIKLRENPEPLDLQIEKVDLHDDYLNHLYNFFNDGFLENRLVVLDLANGAASRTSPEAFERCGAKVICMNKGGGMINKNCGSEHTESLSKQVVQSNAWLGVAHDGDADRAVFVDSSGKRIAGDKILGLLARHAKEKKQLKKSAIVSTIHSNSGLAASLEKIGVGLHRSAVGDRNVSDMMRDKGCNWGGESSGHLVFHDYLPTGDGLFTALCVAEALKTKGGTLESITNWVKLWPSKSQSFKIRKKIPLENCMPLQDALKDNNGRLGENGRILLRYSGTEPIIRLLVEAKEVELVEQAFCSIRSQVEKLL